MSDLKYEKLIYRQRPERGTAYIDGTKTVNEKQEVHGMGFRGACQIRGAKAHLNGGLITQPRFIDPYPHRHPADEYLSFAGAPGTPFDWGDTYIEFTLGLHEEAELYIIDRPTIVRIPANTWHCPLDFIRIDKPIVFQVVFAYGLFCGTYLMPDGEKELAYNGQINCITDPEKHCDCCMKCLSYQWDQ